MEGFNPQNPPLPTPLCSAHQDSQLQIRALLSQLLLTSVIKTADSITQLMELVKVLSTNVDVMKALCKYELRLRHL